MRKRPKSSPWRQETEVQVEDLGSSARARILCHREDLLFAARFQDPPYPSVYYDTRYQGFEHQHLMTTLPSHATLSIPSFPETKLPKRSGQTERVCIIASTYKAISLSHCHKRTPRYFIVHSIVRILCSKLNDVYR